MLVVNVNNGELRDDRFSNVADYLSSNDCIVYNDVKVINARLFGVKEKSGGKIELLLTRKLDDDRWVAIVRPARRVREGSIVLLAAGYSARIDERMGGGLFRVRFSKPLGYRELEEIGEIPLPKYITRSPVRGFDDDRYQTVFSRRPGAVASPTAGLHFTEGIREGIARKGAVFVPVTLYIDWGTFEPVRETDYREHRIHSELYEVSEESVNRCVKAGKRIFCVGTTSVRALETAAGPDGAVRAGRGETDLFIFPGYSFKLTGALLTNFHMPDSTLILLVAAFAGKELVEKAYRHAVAERYRFFSYGDSMLFM
jgi:S-adenosylmethionine:tRNA ribosyltransferase-isomerase